MVRHLRDEQRRRQEEAEEVPTTSSVGVPSTGFLEFEDKITFTVKLCCYFDILSMPTTLPQYAHLSSTFCANYFDLCILRGKQGLNFGEMSTKVHCYAKQGSEWDEEKIGQGMTA